MAKERAEVSQVADKLFIIAFLIPNSSFTNHPSLSRCAIFIQIIKICAYDLRFEKLRGFSVSKSVQVYFSLLKSYIVTHSAEFSNLQLLLYILFNGILK